VRRDVGFEHPVLPMCCCLAATPRRSAAVCSRATKLFAKLSDRASPRRDSSLLPSACRFSVDLTHDNLNCHVAVKAS
jgi:hypothetical protein